MLTQVTGKRRGAIGATAAPGIIRSALVGREPAVTLRHLFANLRDLTRGELIGEDPDRHAEGTRLRVDRTDGHGSYELYRLDQDLFILTIDCLFDRVREEVVTGEGLLEFHVCLRGRLTMHFPHRAQPVVAQGPCLLLLHQPEGADMRERLEAGVRHTGISLYCRPQHLSRLLRRNGILESALLKSIELNGREVWHQISPLTTGLHYAATSLLQSPHQRGFRLLHAEAKALELLCHALCPTPEETDEAHASLTSVVRQLDAARRVLSTQFAPIPRICEIARRVGMSESKLKRAFKEHFGTTIFEYGLECRMRFALELLRTNSMSICQIAQCAGYQHQTSFTAAFRDHYGFLPSDARGRASTPVSPPAGR